jgi:hypothetical protein
MAFQKDMEYVITKESVIPVAFRMDWEDARNHLVCDLIVCVCARACVFA